MTAFSETNDIETSVEELTHEPFTPEVSVVMPCLNEALTLEVCIAKHAIRWRLMILPVKSLLPTTEAVMVRRESQSRQVPALSRLNTRDMAALC